MSCSGCEEQASALSAIDDGRRRRVLWTVLAINLAMFAGELGAAVWAESSALLADAADNLGDVITYAISLLAVGGTLAHRARAASVKGTIQVLFGLALLAEVARKAFMGFEPVAPIIVTAAALALIGNLVCFVLLLKQRNDDINMRSVWLCSRNDVIGNLSVIAVAAVIWPTGWYWLDLAAGAALALLFLRTGIGVLSEARRSLRVSVDAPA